MDMNFSSNEALVARIQQLEHERDELQKDIEQLCMQHAGPSYLAVATRMHFQRTAGLEQEIENLKKKLAVCTREKLNLQEELSEAYRVKSQLADLHNEEVLKNMEAEKQVKFFQGCVAAAFAERDNALMEAEKCKEEELVTHKLGDFERRIEQLNFDYLQEKKLSTTLQIDLERQEKQNDSFKKVINKFAEIRQSSSKVLDDMSWEDKCECLIHDSDEMWSFNDYEETSTSKYITALEEKVKTLTKSVDNLQNRLHMGLEIENHLKMKVCQLEKTNIRMEEQMREISALRNYHSLHRVQITNLLEEGYSNLKSATVLLEEKIDRLDINREVKSETPPPDMDIHESEDVHVHVNSDDGGVLVPELNDPDSPNTVSLRSGEVSKAFSQALQEKVDALLLLSQQEERYLLESNVNATLQIKMEELKKNLIQATNEKVKALMELAQLKQEYRLLQEKVIDEMKEGKTVADTGERRIPEAANGKLKGFLKKTYLRRWINPIDSAGNVAESVPNMDFARMKIENAALRESLENMEHLTSSIHRLRLSLLKVKELVTTTEDAVGRKSEALANIVSEAKLIRTALGSSLPVSWSAECSDQNEDQIDIVSGVGGGEKLDSVSASGFEMVELLILAAQILRDDITTSS